MFLLSFSNAFAQSIDGDDYKDKITDVFSLLNKSSNRIKTGILFESGYNLIEQNRLRSNANAPTDFTTWKAMYYSLQTAQVNNNSQIPTLDDVENTLSIHPREYVVLPILRVAYNNVNVNAFDNGFLGIERDRLIDKSDLDSDRPYDTNTAFSVAPIYEESKNSGTVKFSFPQSHYFTNTGILIKVIYADFADGAGFKPYQLGDTPSITYTSSGVKNLKFLVRFADGNQLKSNSDFKVTVPEGNNYRYSTVGPNTQIPISVGTITGTLQIRYSDGNQPSTSNPTPQIIKPLIVLGGYDPLNKESYRDFMINLNLQVWQFNDNLAGIGSYDLIFLDYGNGGASILNNAVLLEEALRIVNLQKVVNPVTGLREKNVVMGISMGGLVARYALNKIQKGISTITTTHDTRMLITHDSPHQGANTTPGIQFLGRKLIGDVLLRTVVRPFSPVLDDLARFADAPAAREMLSYSTISNGLPLVQNGVGWVANTFFATHYIPNCANVPAVSGGGEQVFRFIATSQGDECGAGAVGAGASLFSSNGGAGAGILWGTFGANIGYEFYMNATNGANRVLLFRLYNQITFFSWLGGGITITNNMRRFELNNPYPALRLDSEPGGITPIGISFAVGVGFNIGIVSFNASANATSARGFCFVPRSSALDTYTPNYAGKLSGGYVGAPGVFNPSRANSFITQEAVGTFIKNIEHTAFTYRQTQWLFEEMQSSGTKQNCAQNCAEPLDIIGGQVINQAGSVSITGNANYTISNAYSVSSTIAGFNGNGAISYYWSIPNNPNNPLPPAGTTPPVITFVGQNTPNVTVTNLSTSVDNNYTYMLTVTIRTNCWTKTITRTICNGGPTAYFIDPTLGFVSAPKIPVTVPLCISRGGYQVSFPGATQIIINGNTIILSTIGNGIFGVGYGVSSGGNVTLSSNMSLTRYLIQASNDCGTGPLYDISLRRLPNCRVVATPTKNPTFTLSPNPSSGNEITISQDISETSSETSASTGEEKEQAQTHPEAKNEEFTLILYNKLQVKVRETTLNTLSKTISTEGLPNDVYFLHIISKDGNRVVKQVMILR